MALTGPDDLPALGGGHGVRSAIGASKCDCNASGALVDLGKGSSGLSNGSGSGDGEASEGGEDNDGLGELHFDWIWKEVVFEKVKFFCEDVKI